MHFIQHSWNACIDKTTSALSHYGETFTRFYNIPYAESNGAVENAS